MKVSQLIKHLKDVPPDCEFLVCGGDFGFLWHDGKVCSVDNSDWSVVPDDFDESKIVLWSPEWFNELGEQMDDISCC